MGPSSLDLILFSYFCSKSMQTGIYKAWQLCYIYMGENRAASPCAGASQYCGIRNPPKPHSLIRVFPHYTEPKGCPKGHPLSSLGIQQQSYLESLIAM
jgi:hypothetical protein